MNESFYDEYKKKKNYYLRRIKNEIEKAKILNKVKNSFMNVNEYLKVDPKIIIGKKSKKYRIPFPSNIKIKKDVPRTTYNQKELSASIKELFHIKKNLRSFSKDQRKIGFEIIDEKQTKNLFDNLKQKEKINIKKSKLIYKSLPDALQNELKRQENVFHLNDIKLSQEKLIVNAILKKTQKKFKDLLEFQSEKYLNQKMADSLKDINVHINPYSKWEYSLRDTHQNLNGTIKKKTIKSEIRVKPYPNLDYVDIMNKSMQPLNSLKINGHNLLNIEAANGIVSNGYNILYPSEQIENKLIYDDPNNNLKLLEEKDINLCVDYKSNTAVQSILG